MESGTVVALIAALFASSLAVLDVLQELGVALFDLLDLGTEASLFGLQSVPFGLCFVGEVGVAVFSVQLGVPSGDFRKPRPHFCEVHYLVLLRIQLWCNC